MYLNPKNLEEEIISLLMHGPRLTTWLVNEAKKKRQISKQAVYKVIRSLQKEEIITISKKEVNLSSIWIKKMTDFFSLAAYYYKRPLNANSFLSLSPSQKVVYSFRSLLELDIFSAHALYLINQVVDKSEPTFIFNYQQWFYYARKENDEFLSTQIKQNERPLLLLLGQDNALNREVKKNYNNVISQCHILEKELFPNNYYFVFMGDFLMEIYLNKDIIKEIDSFFHEYKSATTDTIYNLKNIVSGKSVNKVVISRNAKKIESLKKCFKKYFVF